MNYSKEPIVAYFLLNLICVIVIVIIAAFIFSQIKKDKEESIAEQKAPKYKDLSEAVSKGALNLALMMAVLLLSIFIVFKFTEKKTEYG
jgi:hypothetical protein